MKSLFVNALLATVPALVALFTTWAVVPIEIGGALGEITNRLVGPDLTVELTARESVELFNVYAPNWLGVAAIAFVPIAILLVVGQADPATIGSSASSDSRSGALDFVYLIDRGYKGRRPLSRARFCNLERLDRHFWQ
ncbi:MAG: hypothetical protein HUU60_00420 [Armatimonadetes bacterium]|nr:hypothetical protein [Armatimonadota bacterium]